MDALRARIDEHSIAIEPTVREAVAACARPGSEVAVIVIVGGRSDAAQLAAKMQAAGCGKAFKDPNGTLVFLAQRETVASVLAPTFAKTVRAAGPAKAVFVWFVPGATVALELEPLPTLSPGGEA